MNIQTEDQNIMNIQNVRSITLTSISMTCLYSLTVQIGGTLSTYTKNNLQLLNCPVQ
jgi:hypothetical protein